MRLKGLPENDPTKLAQYQLWIFDKGRIEPEHGRGPAQAVPGGRRRL
jgi:hypothetical protein